MSPGQGNALLQCHLPCTAYVQARKTDFARKHKKKKEEKVFLYAGEFGLPRCGPLHSAVTARLGFPALLRRGSASLQ